MALVLADRVQETTTTSGTGTVTLAGASLGFQSFGTAIGNANTTYYTLVDGNNWEVGIGTYTSSGTTLSRDTVLASSAGAPTKITLSGGTTTVFVTYPAEGAVGESITQTLTNKTISGSSNTITNVSLTTGVTGTLPVANGGTGAATLATNNVLLGNGTSALQAIAPGTSGNVLTSNGTTWASSAPGGNAYTRTSFTATASQTTFTVTYSVGYIQVYLNGVLLNSTDYTASNGTTVVLAVAAALNDIVETIAFSTVAIVNTSANNLVGGSAGSIVYQTGAGATGFSAAGTSGQVLLSGATGSPTWSSSPTLTLTSCTGLPVSTGISGLGAGVATFLATPSSANLATAVTDETGSGLLVFATSPSLTTPVLGTPTSGNLSNCTADGTNAVGYLTIPQNAQTGSYTLVLADSGKSIYHAAAAAVATYTIPANSSVAYALGTTVSIINMSTNAVTIAITTDTLYLAGTGSTGSRTLAQYGVATATKMTSTTWIISGSGLT